jgi:thiamine-monophosphate kinase
VTSPQRNARGAHPASHETTHQTTQDRIPAVTPAPTPATTPAPTQAPASASGPETARPTAQTTPTASPEARTASRVATVGGLGEAGILRILNRRFGTIPAAGDWPAGLVGPGDDAAVVAAPDGRFVISTDAMAQDRDFRLAWRASPAGFDGAGYAGGYSTGWKAAAQNLSDINAMGAEPTGLLLALTMPPTTPVAWIDGLAAGLAGAIRHLGAHRCRIVGGDLGSDDRITLAVTATGDLAGRPAVRRTFGGQPGAAGNRGDGGVAGALDLVLCGRAGWAAAGLAVLETPRHELVDRLAAVPRGEEVHQAARHQQAGRMDQTGGVEQSARGVPGGVPGIRRLAALAAAAQLRPRPVLGAGRRAAEAGALAMMDVSDGVLKDAGRLAEANGMHVELDPDWVRAEATVLAPLGHALGQDAEEWVATGGEDYGLLAAVAGGAAVPSGFRRIGRLLPADAGEVAARPGGPDGWDHFTGA